jgi:hypothetical protein
MKKHNDQPINEVLYNMMRKGPLKKGFYDAQIKTIWSEKLGKLLQKQTIKIFFNQGTIYLSLSSAALRNELLIGKQQLIASFNQELGAEIVKNIIFR